MMGLVEVLTVIFVVLKLVGVISWSWWLVFAPLIVTWALILAFVAGMYVLAGKVVK